MARKKVRERVTKEEIDLRVALLTAHSMQETAEITSIFLQEVAQHIIDQKEVALLGFGSFRLLEWKSRAVSNLTLCKNGRRGDKVVVDIRVKRYVTFRKAEPFTAKIKERFGKSKILKRGE